MCPEVPRLSQGWLMAMGRSMQPPVPQPDVISAPLPAPSCTLATAEHGRRELQSLAGLPLNQQSLLGPWALPPYPSWAGSVLAEVLLHLSGA